MKCVVQVVRNVLLLAEFLQILLCKYNVGVLRWTAVGISFANICDNIFLPGMSQHNIPLAACAPNAFCICKWKLDINTANLAAVFRVELNLVGKIRNVLDIVGRQNPTDVVVKAIAHHMKLDIPSSAEGDKFLEANIDRMILNEPIKLIFI